VLCFGSRSTRILQGRVATEMATHQIPVSTGEYLDRMAVLHVKAGKFMGPRRHDAIKRLYQLERNLTIQSDMEAQINPLYRQLLEIHSKLFDTEDEIRWSTSKMPIQTPGSTKGWFDSAVEDDTVRQAMLKHTQAAYTISKSNEVRHQLIRQIDAITGDSPEPKQYGKQSV
jgi:hypothetical protein